MPALSPDQFADFTTTYVNGGAGGVGSNFASGDTTLLLPSGVGNARFPSAFPYYITVGDDTTASGSEIVKVTARAGDTLTVTRNQGGTNQTWLNGAPLRLTLSALNLSNLWTTLGYGLMYNVKNYGAKGDGSTDDTTAIQAAITAAGNAAGGVVYFPAVATNYKVTGTLTVPANVTLRGDGPGASTITTTSATLDVIVLNDTGSGVCNLHITAAALPFRTAGAGINVAASVYNYWIDNVSIENMWDAIHIGNGSTIPNTIWITNTIIHNVGHAAVYLQSGQNLYVSNVIGWCDSASSSTTGFLWTTQNSVYMSQVTMYKLGTGFIIQPAGANTVQYGWFVNCSADTCATRGWLFDASNNASSVIQMMMLYNCWGASSGTNDGLLFNGSPGTIRNIYIDGFQSYSNGTNGIAVFAGTSQIDFHACRCTGNSVVTPNTNYGIYVAGGITNFSIRGCRSGAFAGFTNRQSYGIFLDTGASNNYNVVDNDVTSNVTAGLADNGTGSAKKLANNLGYNSVGQVTAPAFPATTVAVTNAKGVDVTAYVANGTSAITVIQIAGQAGTYVTTGLQIAANGWGTVRIPAGGGVKFTYAGGAPSWTWFGD
jgi:Pectate lyase superfamily protein